MAETVDRSHALAAQLVQVGRPQDSRDGETLLPTHDLPTCGAERIIGQTPELVPVHGQSLLG